MNPEGFGDKQYHDEMTALLVAHDTHRIETLLEALEVTNRLVERYERAQNNWRRAYSLLSEAYEAVAADEVPA